MKLLLDQGTPFSAAGLLRTAGHDAVHTGEIGMAEAEDQEILARALGEDRIIVTLDADFHAHLAISQANGPSVIRVRIEGLRAEPLAQLVQEVGRQGKAELKTEAMIS